MNKNYQRIAVYLPLALVVVVSYYYLTKIPESPKFSSAWSQPPLVKKVSAEDSAKFSGLMKQILPSSPKGSAQKNLIEDINNDLNRKTYDKLMPKLVRLVYGSNATREEVIGVLKKCMKVEDLVFRLWAVQTLYVIGDTSGRYIIYDFFQKKDWFSPQNENERNGLLEIIKRYHDKDFTKLLIKSFEQSKNYELYDDSLLRIACENDPFLGKEYFEKNIKKLNPRNYLEFIGLAKIIEAESYLKSKNDEIQKQKGSVLGVG